MNVSGKRVIITGGSSGIGLALAELLAAKGAQLLLTGRRADRVDAAVAQIQQSGGTAYGVAADVTTAEGRDATLAGARARLGGIDILVNNAGGVRAGRLDTISEAEVLAMIAVDLTAPILLTRAALPDLRRSGNGLIVNVTSGIALIGMPFYATYAATKAGLARFGEALRRELKGEGVHVMTAYPSATDTPMMTSNAAGPDLGFNREPASAVAVAIVDGIEAGSLEVIRGGETRHQMVALNQTNPAALDERFLSLKPALELAVSDHNAL